MANDLLTEADLSADFVRRMTTYQSDVTYFGENSVGYALAKSVAGQTALTQAQYRSTLRRRTLFGAAGDDLTQAALEMGTRRLGATRARVLVVLRPWWLAVTAVTAGKIEVATGTATRFEVGDTLRIRNGDGSTTEVATIYAVTTGTGPNGGDEIDVGSLLGGYDPTVESVVILLRRTLAAGTVFRSTTGVSFESIDEVTIGDLNPLLNGESASLALSDKVWCEAQTAGTAGNVEAGTVTALQVPDTKVKAMTNPERGRGGLDQDDDSTLKYRAAQSGQLAAVETEASIESLAQLGNSEVLRAFIEDGATIGSVTVSAMTRNLAGLGPDARAALSLFVSSRMRSNLTVEIVNTTLTAVEVEADVSLTPGTASPSDRLRAAWAAASDALAAYLDPRTWPEGQSVDEAQLLSIVRRTAGISSLQTSSFLPAAEVAVTRVPVLVSLRLRDTATGNVIDTNLTVEF